MITTKIQFTNRITMAKYLVETYYTCSFKVSHYLDDINEENLKNLENKDDGKFEIIDVKLDNRKTKNLQDTKGGKVEIVSKPIQSLDTKNTQKNNQIDNNLKKISLRQLAKDSVCLIGEKAIFKKLL